MAKKPKLPEKIYVKRESDDTNSYLVADESRDTMVEMDQTIVVGEYKLVRITTVRGVAQEIA